MVSFDSVPAIITDLMANHAKYTPEKLALIFEEERYTWRELNNQINRVANALIDSGLKKGEKVSVFMSNMAESVGVLFGIIKAGGVLVPLSTMLEPKTMLQMINSSDSKFLFISSDHINLIEQVEHELEVQKKNIIVVGNTTAKYMNFTMLVQDASCEEPGVSIQFDDDCIILFSSES